MSESIGDSYIDSEEVVRRLAELRDERDELIFTVYRLRNDETIETFESRSDADSFVDAEDYDPDRVKVRMTSKGLDGEDEDELNELEIIDRDGSNIFSDWGNITVQLESNIDAEDYAREYVRDNFSTRNSDAYSFVEDYVNFTDLGESLLENVEGGEIGGYNYLYL